MSGYELMLFLISGLGISIIVFCFIASFKKKVSERLIEICLFYSPILIGIMWFIGFILTAIGVM